MKPELSSILKDLGKIAVAFSGGVDSAYLLYAATEALGRENTLAITIDSQVLPRRELLRAEAFCKDRGIEHIVLKEDVFAIEGVVANKPDRCYHCKKNSFTEIIKEASKHGFESVACGTNTDDRNDYRPGERAMRELGILAPLKQAELSKEEIRHYSREAGLETSDLPAMACLASRFPYGDEITASGLAMTERAEDYLRDLGFGQLRVRVHGDVARIELPSEDMARLMEPDIRNKVYSAFKEIGFSYVALDLMGYRTGSLNETIDTGDRRD